MPAMIARDNQPIHYRMIGRGRPVLMLHGVGMDSRHWLPFIMPLAHRFTFVMPDFRGAGKSAAVPVNQPDLFQNLAEDIQDLMSHLDLSSLQLVGYSLGASIALHLQRAGEFNRVKSYLHIDQSPCIQNRPDWTGGLLGPDQPQFLATLQSLYYRLAQFPEINVLAQLPPVEQKTVAQLMGEILGVAAGNAAVVWLLRQLGRYPRLFASVVGDISVHNLCAYLSAYFANKHDYRASLLANKTPMTMFIGRRSPLYLASGQEQFAARVPHCQVKVFERSGHLPQADEPWRFGRELSRFLAKHADAR
jgi:pimeloyl-ACP methyl ester carboxylesterase